MFIAPPFSLLSKTALSLLKAGGACFITSKPGWGGSYGSYTNENPTFSDNKQNGLTYDAAGNFTAGVVTYNAESQAVASTEPGGYAYGFDGDRLRGKKTESGVTTYYLRSSVLGGKIVAEISSSGSWNKGFVTWATALPGHASPNPILTTAAIRDLSGA